MTVQVHQDVDGVRADTGSGRGVVQASELDPMPEQGHRRRAV